MSIPPEASASAQPSPNPNVPSWQEVLKFVREENARDREHLHKTFHIVPWATIAVLTVALTAFFYMTSKSLADAKEAARADMREQLRREFADAKLKPLMMQAASAEIQKSLSDPLKQEIKQQVEMAKAELQGNIRRIELEY